MQAFDLFSMSVAGHATVFGDGVILPKSTLATLISNKLRSTNYLPAETILRAPILFLFKLRSYQGGVEFSVIKTLEDPIESSLYNPNTKIYH